MASRDLPLSQTDVTDITDKCKMILYSLYIIYMCSLYIIVYIIIMVCCTQDASLSLFIFTKTFQILLQNRALFSYTYGEYIMAFRVAVLPLMYMTSILGWPARPFHDPTRTHACDLHAGMLFLSLAS